MRRFHNRAGLEPRRVWLHRARYCCYSRLMESSTEIVVLLHGIGRTGWSMRPLERPLRAAGYVSLNLTYPSRHLPIEDLASFVGSRLDEAGVWSRYRKVHFVTHSMGGLIAAEYLRTISSEQLGRVVMIAPPNGGSEVADLLQGFAPYHLLFGPAGRQVTTTARRRALPFPHYDLGIIAGTRGWPYLLGHLALPRPHDGRVSVARTRHEGMRDHITVHATHTRIVAHPEVAPQVIAFLARGRFDH